MVTPELFSTATRTTGHSSCTAVSRVGSFVASFVVVSRLPYSTVGVVLGLLNLCAAAAALFLPETTGMRSKDSAAVSDCASTFHRCQLYCRQGHR